MKELPIFHFHVCVHACARRMKPHIIILLVRVLFPSRWVCPGIVSPAPYDNLSAPHSDSRWHPIHLSAPRAAAISALKWRYYHRYRPAYLWSFFCSLLGRTPKCARESQRGAIKAVRLSVWMGWNEEIVLKKYIMWCKKVVPWVAWVLLHEWCNPRESCCWLVQHQSALKFFISLRKNYLALKMNVDFYCVIISLKFSRWYQIFVF